MSVYSIDCDLKLTWQQVLVGAARLDDDGNIVLAVSGSGTSPSDPCICPWLLSGSYIYNDPLNTYVGIGTNTPVSELQVISTRATSPRGVMSTQYSTDNSGARFHMRKSRGTLAAPTTIVSGDMLGRLVASGYDGTNYLEMGAIEIASTGTIAAGRVPTKMSFFTATDAAPSVLTERMTILSNGNVGIKTINPAVPLEVTGSIRSSSVIYADGSTTYFGQGSYVTSYAGAADFKNINTGTNSAMAFWTKNIEAIRIDNSQNIGFQTTTPTQIISLGGNVARKIWMERHTTANTAGNTLTLESGGATTGATDKNGGNLVLSGAISTGTGSSDVILKTTTNGATGTTDRTPSDKLQILGRSLLDNTQAGSGYDAGSYIDITPGTSGGMLQLMIGDAQEYVWAIFTSAAVVTLITNSGNVVNTNTDAKFCIVDNGATVRISNALGSTLTMSGTVTYNQ